MEVGRVGLVFVGSMGYASFFVLFCFVGDYFGVRNSKRRDRAVSVGWLTVVLRGEGYGRESLVLVWCW